jgi:hypothetical protein
MIGVVRKIKNKKKVKLFFYLNPTNHWFIYSGNRIPIPELVVAMLSLNC